MRKQFWAIATCSLLFAIVLVIATVDIAIAQNPAPSPSAPASPASAPTQSNSLPRRWPRWLTNPFQLRKRLNFRPPKKKAPSTTGAGGSRNDLRCPGDPQPVYILMPEENYGLTLQPYLSLFLALEGTSAQQLLISLENQVTGHSQDVILPTPSQTGLVKLQLNSTTAELTPGQPYRWFLSVICGDRPTPNDPLFSGWIERQAKTPAIEAALTRSVSSSIANHQIQWYGQQGYWYDLLSLLFNQPDIIPEEFPTADGSPNDPPVR